MDMVRHHDKRVQADVSKALGQLLPDLTDHMAGIIEVRFALGDLAEAADPIQGTDGDEVAAGLGVVVGREPEGGAAARIVVQHQD